jgi:ketosteroid isomerase-like protein
MIIFLTAVAALGLSGAAGAQRGPAPSVQEILIQLERDWDAAFLRKDVAFIETILADDFVATYPDGSRGDKKRELELVASLDQQIDSSTVDDFIVKVNGDTAIVWFTRVLVGPVQGKRTEIVFRFIDVFVWRGERWQCLATQSTRLSR